MKYRFSLAAVLCCLIVWLSPRQSSAQVIISEFMADNGNTLADEEELHPDWIELQNTNSAAQDLNQWSLTQDPTHLERWYFPSTNLPAQGFLIVFASGNNRRVPGAPLHTDFSLKASGEYLALLRPDGSVATAFTPEFPEQYKDYSYGLAQNVTTNVLLPDAAPLRVLVSATNPNLGTTWTQPTFNDAAWTNGTAGVGYETAVSGFAVTNYLATVGVSSLTAADGVIANPAQQLAVHTENAPTINYYNTGDNYAHYSGDVTFPGLTMGVDQNNFVIKAVATITIPSAGNWTFGVSSDDGFRLRIGANEVSYPNPRSPNDTLGTFNFAAAGDYALELVFYENGGGSELELFAAQGAYGAWDATNFKLVGAAGGLEVRAPLVSGSGGASYRPFIQTDVQAKMKGVNASAYIRVPFTLADPGAVKSLTLPIRYDDGFVAYLNGQPVASRNAPANPLWNSAATSFHPAHLAMQFEDVNISDYVSSLRAGANVLAIHGLNQTADDSDFLVSPKLVEYKSSVADWGFFQTATPGALNGMGAAAFVADTKFSVDRGFFNTPFTLAITSATPACTIIYTTNGSTPSLTNGTVYTQPLPINGSRVVRAAAFKTGWYPSGVDTHTYLFLNDVIRQSPDGTPPPGWPSSWGGNVVDYGMDPDIVNNPTYSAGIIDDLKSLPSFSIVTDLPNLFDPATGIYANPGQDGIEWERPASIELIHPDGTDGFQVNAGLRIRGGYSRSTNNPKHAFRILFRPQYGASKLNYPLFQKQDGVDVIDAFDLRTFQNYSWSFEGDYRCIGLRDQWSRDTQFAQGHSTERGDFYHLYINGQYWGVFNTDERGEASYGASYFGGVEEDYDVVKVDTAGYIIYATDGNVEAWRRLWQAATNGFSADANYFKVQGLNLDGTPNPAYENLIDVDNLIDYMLVIFFTGNIDAPISDFLGNDSPNNIYCLRNRTGLFGGFRFLAHDSEHTLHHESTRTSTELTRDRITGPFAAGDPLAQGAGTAFSKSNPQYIFNRLRDNAEFRLRVADHVHQQFFNGGVLTPESCRARLTVRSNEIYRAMAAESARWGDSKRATSPRTRNVDWLTEMNRVYNSYFGQRPGTVLQQLKDNLLYPTASVAPTFNQFGGHVAAGFSLTMSAPAGTIYYTRDGTDPRLRGGQRSPTALTYSGPLSLQQSAHVKARTLNNGVWSALTETTFYVIRTYTDLLVTEIMYHPLGTTNIDGDDFEFVELKNIASTTLELSGVSFTNGIVFTFPVGTFLAPGQFAILVSNPSVFTNRYPTVPVAGTYTGRLSNSGERLTLVHAHGLPIFTVAYDTRPPWPASADGTGFSIAPVNPNFNPAPDNAVNWRASSVIGGTPAADDQAPNIAPVYINEALTHTDLPAVDTVELYNPNSTNVVIGGWYITDDLGAPQKYRIAPGKSIPPNGYALFTEEDWNADPSSSNSFRLDSHGERIYLFSADADGNLTGYSHGFSFGSAQNGVSFGRYITSTGEAHYPAQRVNSLGTNNVGPRLGPVVLNEIQYHPAVGFEEFIELKSITNATVKLYDPAFPTNTWRLNGAGFDFPRNTELPAGGLLLVVGGDPAAFRAKYGVPAGVQIFGPFAGNLQDSGEELSLQYPDHPDLDTNTGAIFIPYIDVDVVRYNDKSPWPTNADGLGPSLERKVAAAYGNDPVNWRTTAGSGSPGLENDGNRLPVINAGPDNSYSSTTFPFALPLTGAARDDGLPDPPARLTTTWSFVSGPGPVWFSDPDQTNATAYFPGSGTYLLRLTASDGALQVSDDLAITLQRPLGPVTFVPWGARWKYLDNGSDQGTNYAAITFDDRSWAEGPAPLGYDNANGIWPATTNSYGGNSNNKYITTYYRHNFLLTNPSEMSNVVLSVKRDDGILVYLNGTPIFTNNLPNSFIGYLTNASSTVGTTDETNIYSAPVPASRLRNGTNVMAVEIHQSGPASSDIFFDLQLTGETYPVNQPPTVAAGPDQSLTTGTMAGLSGTAADDGLPIPPGLLTFTWSRVSGPGAVTFTKPNALQTTASFAAGGTYVLRLTVTDGAAQVSDDLNVTVPPQEVVIDSVDFPGGWDQGPRLRFSAVAGASYSVQYSEHLAAQSWLILTNVLSQPQPRTIEVWDVEATNSPARYYRVVTPALP